MTSLFLTICSLSLVFFLIFLAQCCKPKRAFSRLRCKSKMSVVQPLRERRDAHWDGAKPGSSNAAAEHVSDLPSRHQRTTQVVIAGKCSLPLVVRWQEPVGRRQIRRRSQSSHQNDAYEKLTNSLDHL